MLNKNQKKKYRKYRDSIDDDNNSESEYENGNIDLIINKLENKLNTGNINSGNADVILKIPHKNDETIRSSKISEGIIKNIPQLLENTNIKEKDNELSQENCENSMENGMKISNNSTIDIDVNININNNLEKNLKKIENKSDLILSTTTNNSYRNTDMYNSNILSRNKLKNINENNLSKLSIHLDNSKYFLSKRNLGLISLNKHNVKDSKDNNNNGNKKENEKKENGKKKEKKRVRIRNNNVIMNKNNKITYGYKFRLFWNDFCDERTWRRRCRNCNIVTIIRDVFITVIIVSALAFYATIFIVG